MPGEIWKEGPEEWQRLIVRLLKLRYSIGAFLEIPDTVQGDYGLEGFSRDGVAIQCYAAEEPCEVAKLTKAQKAKITTDIGKLDLYQTDLAKLLSPTKIHTWILVVPRWEDKSVLAHAEKKLSELRCKKLPFISEDCSAAIVTLDDFIIERQKLATTWSGCLEVDVVSPDDGELIDWAGNNDPLLKNLSRKALILTSGNDEKAKRFRDLSIQHYLRGQNALQSMQVRYPQLYEYAFKVKSAREEKLEYDSFISDSTAKETITQVKATLLKELSERLPGLAASSLDTLVQEAIADWLLRCPLDFE